MTGILDVLFHRFKHLLLLYGGAGDFEYWRFVFWKSHLKISYHHVSAPPHPQKSLQVHEYLRSKLCSLYENDCIFDKFECCWNGNDR